MGRRAEARALAASAPLFAALGDETRLRLVARLCDEGPLSVSKLTAGTEISRQGITKHLRVLETAGVLRASRAGREQLWELEPRRLLQAQACLVAISSQWDDALERLRRLVEE